MTKIRLKIFHKIENYLYGKDIIYEETYDLDDQLWLILAILPETIVRIFEKLNKKLRVTQ